MIHGDFKGGPAAGELKSFERAPGLLRVVLDGDKVDVLDQLDDEPKPSEKIYVYVRSGGATGHLDYRGKDRALSGPMIVYNYCPVEDTERFRDTATWRAWCDALAEWVKANGPTPVSEVVEHVRGQEGHRAST